MEYSFIKLLVYLKIIIITINIVFSTQTDIALLHYKQLYVLKDVANKLPISSTKHEIQTDLIHPMGLTFDRSQNLIYFGDWHDKSNVSIYYDNISKDFGNLSTPKPLVQCSTYNYSFKRLKYDAVNKQVIAMEFQNRKGIYVIDVQSHQAKLVHPIPENEDPVDMDIDNQEQKVYWITEFDNAAFIYEWDMKRSSNNIIKGYLQKTRDISYKSVSLADNNVYVAYFNKGTRQCTFIRFFKKHVMSVKNEEQLFTFEQCFPHSILVDGDFIYWTDHIKDSVLRQSLQKKNKEPVNLITVNHTISLHGYHYVYDLVLLSSASETNTIKTKTSGIFMNDSPDIQTTDKKANRKPDINNKRHSGIKNHKILNITSLFRSKKKDPIIKDSTMEIQIIDENTDSPSTTITDEDVIDPLNAPTASFRNYGVHITSLDNRCFVFEIAAYSLLVIVCILVIIVVLLTWKLYTLITNKKSKLKQRKIYNGNGHQKQQQIKHTTVKVLDDVEDMEICDYPVCRKSCIPKMNLNGHAYGAPKLFEKPGNENKNLLDESC